MSDPPKDDFRILYVNDWPELVKALNGFPESWVFRGHARSSWMLESSLERARPAKSRQADEQRLTRHFQARAHHFLAAQQVPATTLEWLALIQHHGGPTRLLDCTESPYVAAYFALEDETDGDSAIWCIDRTWCIEETRDRFVKKGARSEGEAKYLPYLLSIDDDYFRKWLFPGGMNLVVPLQPRKLNERITIQQGAFLCMGNVGSSFVQNLVHGVSADRAYDHFIKVVFPNRIRVEALPELRRMNITRASLFPGLDGLAQSLRTLLIDMSASIKALLRVIEGPTAERAVRPSLQPAEDLSGVPGQDEDEQ